MQILLEIFNVKIQKNSEPVAACQLLTQTRVKHSFLRVRIHLGRNLAFGVVFFLAF